MAYQLSFAILHNYDSRKIGITVPVWLKSGAKAVNIEAKLDTGSSLCVFRHGIGELLGLHIESGTRQEISTATGSFIAYGHEVLLHALGIEFTSTVFFAAEEGFNRDVLGRQGWLDRMLLGIVDHDGALYLSHYDDVV